MNHGLHRTRRAFRRRSTAAIGIAGLALAGLATPAFASPEDGPTAEESEGGGQPLAEDPPGEELPNEAPPADEGDATDESDTTENGGDDTDDAAPEADGFSMETLSVDGDVLTVDLVGLNDFHGRIDAGLKYDADDNLVQDYAAVRLAAAVEAARADNSDTLFVGAGDLYSASTFTSMAGNDIPTTDVFNAIKMDASSVGNHEFDRGFADLQDRIAGNGEFDGHKITWDYLGANVYEKGTTNTVLEPYAIFSIGGADIAFIGLVTQETPSLVTPAGIAGLDFGDPTAAVERVIAGNTDVRNADAVVILTHDGASTGEAVTDTSTHFGKFVADMAERGDIAGIFSGHTHTTYQVDVPTTIDTIGEMPVIQTGSFGDNLGLISLSFAVDTDALTFTGASSDMSSLAGVEVPAPGVNGIVDQVRAIVDAAVTKADEIGLEVIGEAGADLNRAVQDFNDEISGNPAENRGGESTINNLIADAQLWAIHDQAATEDLPTIGFMNPGGIRTDIAAGEVTYKQVATVQPFANTLETFDLTGAQILQVLEEQWQPAGSSRPFLKLGVAGLTYTYDPAAPRGERITQVFLAEGTFDIAATYRVVANNFLASGGDNFFTLGLGTNYADTGVVDLKAFIDFFEAADVVYPDYTQRGVGVSWVTDAEQLHRPGDTVEINVSSLVFSTNEPKMSELDVAIAGLNPDLFIDIGAFTVDPSIVSTNDEGGQAVVKFIIPENDAFTQDGTEYRLLLLDNTTESTYPVSIHVGATIDDGAIDDDGTTDDGTTNGGATSGGDPDGGNGGLPSTGADVTTLVIAGLALLMAGGVALGIRRRNLQS